MLMVRTISSAPVGPIPQDHGSPSLHSRLHYSEGSHFWILKIKYPHDHKLPVPLSHPYYILIDLWNFCPLITLLPPYQILLDLASCSIQLGLRSIPDGVRTPWLDYPPSAHNEENLKFLVNSTLYFICTLPGSTDVAGENPQALYIQDAMTSRVSTLCHVKAAPLPRTVLQLYSG